MKMRSGFQGNCCVDTVFGGLIGELVLRFDLFPIAFAPVYKDASTYFLIRSITKFSSSMQVIRML